MCCIFILSINQNYFVMAQDEKNKGQKREAETRKSDKKQEDKKQQGRQERK